MNQLCKVCGEPAAGFHFGAFTCEGCKSFFGRTYNNIAAIAGCKNNGTCVINKKNRTNCKACRLRKCLLVGMSKSGSRYGRRSNWFKIHCLLQEQQQQQQQHQQQNLQSSQQLQQHDIVTTTTTIGGHTDAIASASLSLRVNAGAVGADAIFGGLFVPDCQHLVVTNAHSNITSTTTSTTTTTTIPTTLSGVSNLTSQSNKSNANNYEDLVNLQRIETQLHADKELITPTESNICTKMYKSQQIQLQQQQQQQEVTSIETNMLTSTPVQQSKNLLSAAAKFLNSVMVGANNSNNSQHTHIESSDSGASSVHDDNDNDNDDDFKSYFNWNEEDSLYKTDIEMERKHEKRRRHLLQKFLRPHSEPPQANATKIATLTPLLNIGLFPLDANSLTSMHINKSDTKDSITIMENSEASLQQDEPIDLSFKTNCMDFKAQQGRITRSCTKQKLSVPLDLRIERSSANQLSR